MEQLKIFSKKKIIKTSQSLDDIVVLKEHHKKNKAKSSTLVEEQKNDNKKDSRYNIIATSVVNDNDNQLENNVNLPFNIKQLKKNDNKQKSEPNLFIKKSNKIEYNDRKDESIKIIPELKINEVPMKSYINDNDSPNNISPKNLSFDKHYKNNSESNGNGKGFNNHGDKNRIMEDENNYKEDNNDDNKKKGKEGQVIIEEISAEKFFEYLSSSNISKINDNNLNKGDGLYSLLIFDFRVFSDFKNEYISNSINVNIPSLILNRSMKYQYTNSFNIQNFVSPEDKLVIQQWILNNYKVNQNQNFNHNTKPLIIVYDDQNLMDVEVSSSPVKTVMRFLEVQHIIALNELKYSSNLLSEQCSSSSTDNSQSNQGNDINNYLLNKQLNIAWVTGGYDAICTHSESGNYILNNEPKDEDIPLSVTQPDDFTCGTPLKLKPTLNLKMNTSNNIECSTPIDGKHFGFNDQITNKNNNKPNLALNMLNKNKSGKQKLSLNIKCAVNNNTNDCKTPLSAIPNGKENILSNINCSTMKKPNNLSITTPSTTGTGTDEDLYPKIQRRKKSTLLISVNNFEKKTDQPVPQIQPNGMLGVASGNKGLYTLSLPEDQEVSFNKPKKDLLRVKNANNFSPSSDLPLNISPTTSTVIPHYTKVLPYLYIGTETIPASENAVERLKQLKVTHVLNVATECNIGVTFPEDQIVYKKIDLADNLAENIAKYLWESSEWIENERKKNNNAVFYIHCKAGKSRSATVVIAYLMKVEHWSLNKAYTYLKDLRPNISPNLGFMSALLEMEAEIKKQEEQKATCNENSEMNINSDNNTTNNNNNK